MVFEGEIHAEEDLNVDGTMKGLINVPNHVVTLGKHCRVQADVRARSLVLHGNLEGRVTLLERIVIKSTGSLEGDLVTHRVVIEDGAVFRGSCDIKEPEAKQAAPAEKRKAAAAPEEPKKAAVAGPATPSLQATGRAEHQSVSN